MKKVKMFFVAAALMLVTVGVFAGKAKFISSGLVAYASGIGYVQISTSSLPTDLQTTANGAQVTIKGKAGLDRSVFDFDGVSTYTPVYSSSSINW